jgi:hypothetical protein
MSERDSEPKPHNAPHPLDAAAGTHPPIEHHGQQHHDEHAHGQHDHGVRQMEDQPNVREIFIVAVVGIVITVVSVYISWGYQLSQEAQINAAPTPATVPGSYLAKGNAGIVERQELPDRAFEVPNFDAQELRRNQEAELSTYGWVDRPRGLIRIPIKQAMDQVVQAYGQHK